VDHCHLPPTSQLAAQSSEPNEEPEPLSSAARDCTRRESFLATLEEHGAGLPLVSLRESQGKAPLAVIVRRAFAADDQRRWRIAAAPLGGDGALAVVVGA
jgi:hypothetical protein